MKGTTHAKIDVMKGFAVVAFAAGCSSVQLQHIIAELDRENRAGHSPVEGEQSTGKNLDQAKVTPSLPPTPFPQSVKNNISYYIHESRGNLSTKVCKAFASKF